MCTAHRFIMLELTQANKEDILRKCHVSYRYITEAHVQESSYHLKLEPVTMVSKCWCTLNKGSPFDGDICPGCLNDHSRYYAVVPKNMEKALKAQSEGHSKYYTRDVQSQLTLQTLFYARKHPEKDGAIQILKLSITVKAGNTAADPEELVWKIMYAIDIIPNEGSRAYKIVRGKEVEINLFDAFQINSQTMNNPPTIIFEDSDGMIDFILKNKKFSQYTGFIQCFNLADLAIPRNAFFMLYAYLYAQYPVVELVVKMGYISLLTQTMRLILGGYNKENIRSKANDLTKILNCEATNGSVALTVPRYIADDLNARNAYSSEYVLWGDICQLSGGISKENYMKETRNDVYANLGNKEDIPTLMKYGYSVHDIFKYLRKQGDDCDRMHYRSTLILWRDYLHMCDMMGITPDKYPMDIRKAHDSVALAYKAKENEMHDKSINQLAIEAEKCLPEDAEYNDSEYVIMLPHSSRDIIQEGQAMHNCVGSYIQRVSMHNSLVFFIRLKSAPNESFVTAEYKRGSITQLYYKNNQPVNNQEIHKVAQKFKNKLNGAHINIA